ncbi:MAG: peptidylprolyl isomerase [Bacteroidota bacterium]
MLRVFSLILFISASLTANTQVIFRYGPHAVQKDEFWKAYSKNNSGVTSEASIREYLDLYVKFKLKVQAARDQKLDTLASIKNDVAGFRAQMAEQYMQKLPFRKETIEQAAERSKTRLELSHIFIDYGGDTSAAKIAIDKAYAQLQAGADFAITSRNISNDPYVKAKDGYIGYISVFSLPYELENTVYALKKGAYSTPVAGKNGWHIFKVSNIQPNTTLIQAAQILLAVSPELRIEEKSMIKQKADNIYEQLMRGADFAELAKQYSNDKFTYQNGGVLPAFKYSDFDPVFANAVVDLKNEGDISKPIETSAGWHIVKLRAKEEVRIDLNNVEEYEEWTQKVSQDDRIKVVTEKEKQAVRNAVGYKELPYNQMSLWNLSDSLLKAENYVAIYKDNKQNKLFQLNGKAVTVTDWLMFVKDKKMAAGDKELNSYNELMKEFAESTVTQYYKDNLEKINPDFRYQMQEFLEGSLLFEVMERNVWSVAPSDSTGLKNFYTPRASQYLWKQSVSAVIFNCADTATAHKIQQQMKQDPLQWKQYTDEANGYALADSSRFEKSQLPVDGNISLTGNWLSPVITNAHDGSSSFCYITMLHPDNELRNFNDAKGLVINDYQVYLEEQWLAGQKKKYPVKIDEAVVRSLKK